MPAGSCPGVTVLVTNTVPTPLAPQSPTTRECIFPFARAGTYTLRAERPGFKPLCGIRLNYRCSRPQLSIVLQVGQVSESVEVQGDAAALVTDNATVGTVIETSASSNCL